MENLTQFGTVVGVDNAKALVQVGIFGRITDWIPYVMRANSSIKIWTPPQIGEQVSVIMVHGEDGYAMGSIYNIGCKEPAWANDHTYGIEFTDGTVITYDIKAKVLNINASGSIAITAPSGIAVTANTVITGNVTIDGNLSVSGSISDQKGSLTSHVHGGVMSGGQNTGGRP